jgi:DDE superfamily endonuclease
MAATFPHLNLHPQYILREGLILCNVDETVQQRRGEDRNVRNFKTFFGRHPRHLARVWRDLQIASIMTIEEAQDRESFDGFLIANNFLRCYEPTDVRAARFNFANDKLLMLQWRFIEWLDQLKSWKIKCPTQWPVRFGATCDGTHARTNEPRDPDMRRNPKNFSYKHNYAGLNYQIVLATWTNRVLYANAGDPSSVHDMTAIRREFVDMVPAGCRVIADNGYVGKTENEKKTFATKNHLDHDEVAFFKARARARQEQFNSRMKSYKCLSGTFVHGIPRHRQCFAAVLVLQQYAIEDTSDVGEPLDTL